MHISTTLQRTAHGTVPFQMATPHLGIDRIGQGLGVGPFSDPVYKPGTAALQLDVLSLSHPDFWHSRQSLRPSAKLSTRDLPEQ